jgi:hypothetical protein
MKEPCRSFFSHSVAGFCVENRDQHRSEFLVSLPLVSILFNRVSTDLNTSMVSEEVFLPKIRSWTGKATSRTNVP